MSWHKIKRRQADILFSQYVRKVSRGCVFKLTPKCKLIDGMHDWRRLQVCHFHSRRKESVRFDLDNVDAGCPTCHRYLSQNRSRHKAFKRRQLGKKLYDALKVRAEIRTKKDDKLQVIIWAAKLKEL